MSTPDAMSDLHLFYVQAVSSPEDLAERPPFDIPAGASPQTMGFKAYNLMRMARIGLPVPPAMVLGTWFCHSAASQPQHPSVSESWPVGLGWLESATGLVLGDARCPLLVSVRSGAPVSMPGMMETLLNIGLCHATVPGLLRRTGNPRLVWDAYRRLVASFGEVVHGLPANLFDDALRQRFDGIDERDLDFAELRELTDIYLTRHQDHVGKPFPQDPREQLQCAIEAVLTSWQSNKAREYRRINQLPDELGTAVTVQQMVFGNGGGACGAGVGFTRNPATGEPGLWVDFLFNAQGEDVVSGRRSAHGHATLADVLPDVWSELEQAAQALEREFADMQDIEFTVQDGRLFMLQTRSGKRTPQAAARIALDMLAQGLITPEMARRRLEGITPAMLALTRVVNDEGEACQPIATAASASSGVVTGEVALTEARARARHDAGASVILVRQDAETSDLAALQCAAGLLTQRGARTSHAAVVARQLGKVCLVGCEDLRIDEAQGSITLGALALREGDLLTLDGNTGGIYGGAIRTVTEEPLGLLQQIQALRDG